MTNFNTVFQHIIRMIECFISELLPHLSKPTRDFYLDMIFGILKSSSLVLNDIAHSLNEKTTLKQVNERLSSHLSKGENTQTKHNYINKCLKYLNQDHYIFIVDDSDIIKPYGHTFESLGIVRDGSSKKNDYENGYLMTTIVGLTSKTYHPICLFNKVHSSTEKNYLSTNNITHQAILSVLMHTEDKLATFIFDRGFDNKNLILLLMAFNAFFIIRAKTNRTVMVKNRKSSILQEAKRHKGKVNVNIKIKGVSTTIKASHIVGKINGVKEKLTIIFSYLPNSTEPMILLTNHKINSKEDLIQIILFYNSRWRIEEYYRFKKVELGLENFRVKSLKSINHLFFISDICTLLMAHIIESQNKNMIYNELIGISKGIRDDIQIKYYQLLSGIKTLFLSRKNGVQNFKRIERWKTEEPNLFNSLELSIKKRVRK